MNLKNTSTFLLGLTLLVSSIAMHESTKANIIATETVMFDSHINEYKASKIAKKRSLLKLTLNKFEQGNDAKTDEFVCKVEGYNDLFHIEQGRFVITYLKIQATPVKIDVVHSNSNEDIDQMHAVLPSFEVLEINKQLVKLQQSFDRTLLSEQQNISNKNTAYNEMIHNHFKNVVTSKDLYPLNKLSKKVGENSLSKAMTIKEKNLRNLVSMSRIGYWQTVHSIESKQGKLLFRPRNKSRNCNQTSGPCGHHQLTVQALKDIGCNSLQCRKDRLDYKKSLKLSKKLLALNEKRLRKNGISKLRGYQKYLIHQQGASGIKNIIAATQGKKDLSMKLKKNMANNSPFSYKQLKNMSSKAAANKFMDHWKSKWVNEKRIIVASQATTLVKTTNSLINTDFIPTFDDSELNLALNIRF